MGKYKIPQSKSKIRLEDSNLLIANELAELVEATNFSGRQLKEANRLKRLELEMYLVTHHHYSKYEDKATEELEDKA